ncbi:MAG: recombinase family protein [Ruminococcus sp.]|nr:recombinase family protein [Ruminococcus sp.]
MKAVIYARYSCDHQREESIDGQLRECKEFAQKQGYIIIGSYIDRAMSAKTDNRPQFQQMIKDSAKGGFDIIIVWKLDRFARNRYDSAHYKSILRRNGVKVVSATEVISEGAEGIILESVLEGYAEYYSAELSEKVIRGLTENALKCQYNGSPVPVGYTIDETKHYQLEPTTAPFIKDAFEMYASGKMVKDIYEYLNSKGVKTSYGKPMNKTNTTAILRNTKYRGQYCYRDIKIENGVPRIVSDELFEAVQRRLNKNQISRSHFKAKHEYFLSSKMVCSDCGALMVGESGTSRKGTVYNYYKCANVKKRLGCHRPSLRKDLAEKLVFQKVMDEMFTEDMIERIADKVMEVQKQENSAIPLLQKQLAEIEKGIVNMLNAMQAGILTKSTKARLEELEAQKEKLELDIMKEQLHDEILTRDQVVLWLKTLKTLDLTSDDNKRILVDTFINSIMVYDNKLAVSFNFRDGAGDIPLLRVGCSDGDGLGAPIHKL